MSFQPLAFSLRAAFAYFACCPACSFSLPFWRRGNSGQSKAGILCLSGQLVSSLYGLCISLPLVICALSFTGLITSQTLSNLALCHHGAGVVAAGRHTDPTVFPCW